MPSRNQRRARDGLVGIKGIPFGEITGTRCMVINLAIKYLGFDYAHPVASTT
ncbi:hypothetical protein [Zarconia navalis]|uniref:hypothetical protein n=1 Tax=Zarconia navalis TaxID=2992134 RepID=UPI003F93BF76